MRAQGRRATQAALQVRSATPAPPEASVVAASLRPLHRASLEGASPLTLVTCVADMLSGVELGDTTAALDPLRRAHIRALTQQLPPEILQGGFPQTFAGGVAAGLTGRPASPSRGSRVSPWGGGSSGGADRRHLAQRPSAGSTGAGLRGVFAALMRDLWFLLGELLPEVRWTMGGEAAPRRGAVCGVCVCVCVCVSVCGGGGDGERGWDACLCRGTSPCALSCAQARVILFHCDGGRQRGQLLRARRGPPRLARASLRRTSTSLPSRSSSARLALAYALPAHGGFRALPRRTPSSPPEPCVSAVLCPSPASLCSACGSSAPAAPGGSGRPARTC